MEDPGELERRLALAAQAGSRSAFDQLVRLQKGPLYRFVRRYVGDADDAFDIVQDTFVSAWLALKRFDARHSFAVWLRAIALNKCRDHGRRRAALRRVLTLFSFELSLHHAGDGDAEPAGVPEPDESRRLRQLDEAIAALPRRYKEPLLLTLISGLTQQEAAEQLDTTPKAIEMRIRRAKQRLGQALSPTAVAGSAGH